MIGRIGNTAVLTAGLVAAGAGLSRARAETPPVVEELHRLYDMKPVSADNPVLARVPDCEIEVPLSEFRAYLSGAVSEERLKTLTPEETRQSLAGLLNEHLLLWDGYQQKADQSKESVAFLAETRNILMVERLTQIEADEKARTAEEQASLPARFRARLFEQAGPQVLDDAWAVMRAEAKRLDHEAWKAAAVSAWKDTVTTPGLGETEEAPPPRLEVAPEVRDRPLVVFRRRSAASPAPLTVTVGEFLSGYAGYPLGRRPKLEERRVVLDIAAPMTQEALALSEARARGLDQSPFVREMLQSNRNTLVKAWVMERLTQQAVEEKDKPGLEQRLRQWYQQNLKTLYTYQDDAGRLQVKAFENEREAIENDYVSDLRERLLAGRIHALREGRKIWIDEALLEQAIP